MKDTDLPSVFKEQTKEIESYLRSEFPDGSLRGVDQSSRLWLCFSVDLERDSVHVAFAREFIDAPVAEIRRRLRAFDVAGEMRRAGREKIVLTRSTGICQHPTQQILPPA